VDLFKIKESTIEAAGFAPPGFSMEIKFWKAN
jgi:hypothetical protein